MKSSICGPCASAPPPPLQTTIPGLSPYYWTAATWVWGAANRSSWASWCWSAKCQPLSCGPVAAGLWGCCKGHWKHGSISNLPVMHAFRSIFSCNDSAERRYLPLTSHWLGSSIHEIPYQELSCTSVKCLEINAIWPAVVTFLTQIISKWHVKDYVQQSQYSMQDFQYHCNDPLLKKGEKAQTQHASESALKAKENREVDWLTGRGLTAGFNPLDRSHIQVTPAFLGERGKQNQELETKALVSLVPLCDSAWECHSTLSCNFSTYVMGQ